MASWTESLQIGDSIDIFDITPYAQAWGICKIIEKDLNNRIKVSYYEIKI